MAGDWIKIRCELIRDPDVIGLAATTGLDEFGVVGRLVALWSWADQHTVEGHAPSVTKAWLDRTLQRDGMADALEAIGWIRFMDSGGIEIPNYTDHNGQNAKKRAQAAKRKQKQRAEAEAPPPNVTPPAAQMSRPGRDTHGPQGVTREEKRREEDLNPPTPQRGAGGGGFQNGRRKRKPTTPKANEPWRVAFLRVTDAAKKISAFQHDEQRRAAVRGGLTEKERAAMDHIGWRLFAETPANKNADLKFSFRDTYNAINTVKD